MISVHVLIATGDMPVTVAIFIEPGGVKVPRDKQGQGFHNNRHGRAILPDTLRWLWRDYTSQPTGTASR